MRSAFVIVHRWAGLFIAVFLFIAGLTGAVISWDHELDEWLNPNLHEATHQGPPLAPLDLLQKVEATDPRGQVTSVPLSFEKGETAAYFVEPRINLETGELYTLDYNQAFVDPATGEIVGKRYWGRIALDKENLLPFLYKLHYSMHIPDFFNFDRWGLWFMGIVGIVWLFDCFVGFYLTLPSFVRGPAKVRALSAMDATAGRGDRGGYWQEWWQRWKPAWQIKRNASTYRLNLDLHRAFGLWLWLMLLILAFTSVSMNLGNEVVRPILNTFSSLTTDAFDDRTPTAMNKPIPAVVPFKDAIEIAQKEATKQNWDEPVGSAFYGRYFGVYAIQFFHPGDDHGSGGMGVKTLMVDAKNGDLLGSRVPWEGTAADVFMQLQFPLHSGRIAGIPGRILLSVMGVVVALLSFTGIVIWFKKRQSRLRVKWRSNSADTASDV
ncbi:peptidase [Hyphomicrobium methylovorum]|uniref:PepSY domain-containing protein n=1 Tax=Hyphomicrobium methylovorum TaxID=84 RepID=UPI0015E673C3|nr:peptidase [Hyphomicrobium methylovorum]